MKFLRIAAAAVALAAAGLLGGPALSASADVPASNPIQYITYPFWSDSSAVTSIQTLACPSGTRLVSAGAGAGGGVTGLSPNYDFTAVTASAKSYGYWQITVGCAPAAQISEVSTVRKAFSLGVHQGTVTCPAGTRAFGGGGWFEKPFGALSGDSFGMKVNSLTSDGTGWTFAGATTNRIDRLTIYTQCAPLRNSYVASGIVASSDDGSQRNVYAACQPGYTALSGGAFLANGNGGPAGAGLIKYSIPASDNRWYVQGAAYTGSTKDKIISYLQCIR